MKLFLSIILTIWLIFSLANNPTSIDSKTISILAAILVFALIYLLTGPIITFWQKSNIEQSKLYQLFSRGDTRSYFTSIGVLLVIGGIMLFADSIHADSIYYLEAHILSRIFMILCLLFTVSVILIRQNE